MTEEEKKDSKASDSLENKTSLKKLGSRLPLGFALSSGEYARDIAVRPWRMKEEKEIGKLRSEDDSASVGQFVTSILATLCTRLGAYDFEQMKFGERKVAISQMFMGDVFYAYMWLRVQSIGNILSLEFTCPHCRKIFSFDADLSTTEIAVANNVEEASWSYDLEHPIQLRGNEVTGFRMGPPKWSTMEEIGESGADSGVAKAGMIAGSILGIKGQEGNVIISSDELDDLVKIDIEKLTRGVEDFDLGPDMSVEAKCSRCHKSSIRPLTWSYDNFFGVSSR